MSDRRTRRPPQSQASSSRASTSDSARMRNSHNFLGDILRGKNKIYTPACDCALRHIRLPGCVGLLRDGNPAHFFYAAQRRCPIAIIARDNHSDKFTVPVLR